MGWWQVNADTLAGSRFVVSPLAETFACLKLLHAGRARIRARRRGCGSGCPPTARGLPRIR